MYLSKSKCWYSNNCLQFLKCAVALTEVFPAHFAMPISCNCKMFCEIDTWSQSQNLQIFCPLLVEEV